MRNFVVLLVLITPSLTAQTFEENINKGDVFYNAGNYVEAIRYFSQAIELDKKNVKGYWYRADAYRQNLQYTEGVADYTKALELEPQNVKFLTRRGDCYYNLNQFQLALNDYARALEYDKTNATLWLYRGDSYAKLNDSNNACDDYQQAFELGDKSAKVQARLNNCDWVKALQKPCPKGEAPINRMDIEPFSGATIISRGLTYDKFEVLTVKDENTVTGPEYAMGEEFDFKITKPKDFCKDDDDAVFFGIGVTLKEGEKELISVGNIYEGQEQGVMEESIKFLASKVDFRAPMELGKMYQLAIRFFDTHGNGEVSVQVPIKLTAVSHTSNTTFRTESSLGAGIKTASVGIEPIKLECRQKGKKETLKSYILNRNLTYSTTLMAKAALPKGAVVYHRLVSVQGDLVFERAGKVVINQSQATFEIITTGLKPGTYKLWTRISDPESTTSIGLVMPVVVR